MKEDKEFESLKAIEKALRNIDLPRFLYDLEMFAKSILIARDKHAAQDIVNDFFEKLLSRNRNWKKGTDFKTTVYLGVKSLCNNYYNKQVRRKQSPMPEIATFEIAESNDSAQIKLENEELRHKAISALKNQIPPPTLLEEMIFECWLDDISKQQEISELLEEDIIEIRKAIKRLKRKLPFVQDEIQKYI